MNPLFKIGIVGGLAYGVYKVLGMKKISEKVITSLSNPRVHAIDLRGMVVRTEIKVDNPTRSRMTITKPVITLYTNGRYISSSKPENKIFRIEPLSQTVIDTIEMAVPWNILLGYVNGLLPKIPKIIAAFKSKDMNAVAEVLSIPLEMQYSLYANGLSYESEVEKIL